MFICSTAGTCGAGEPTYVTAAVGNTTTDSGCTWTYIGTSFSSWAAPHARLNNAHTTNWGAAGDTFLLGSDHAETQAATLTLALVGSATSPTFNYSIDVAGSVVACVVPATIEINTRSLPLVGVPDCRRSTPAAVTVFATHAVTFDQPTGVAASRINQTAIRRCLPST